MECYQNPGKKTVEAENRMRIISLAPSNTEILYSLGAGEQIVATTSLCDHPDKAVQKPRVGGWSRDLDIQKVVEFNPDIAVASDDLQDKVVEKLVEEEVDVVQVKPHTLEDVFDSIEVIGRVVKKEQKARKLVKDMREQLESISIHGGRIYCEEWTDPPMVSGNWVPGLVESIGGDYFIEEGERSREFKLESLKEFNPEYIFLNVCGAGDKVSREEMLEREDWQEITAVEKGNIYVVDDALLNRPGPRLVKGAQLMAEFIS